MANIFQSILNLSKSPVYQIPFSGLIRRDSNIMCHYSTVKLDDLSFFFAPKSRGSPNSCIYCSHFLKVLLNHYVIVIT